jgi:Ca-activated chloride channel family protein
MSFTWVWAFLLLLLLPLGFWIYRKTLKPSAKSVVLYPGLSTLIEASKASSWRNYLPVVLYGLALTAGIVALARPVVPIPIADPRAGIILAIDVSRSMMATDIKPNRFDAARVALKTFVESVPKGTHLGLVTFARYATTVVPLTDDHATILKAVEMLEMDFGTVIGDGLMESMSNLPSLKDRKAEDDDPSKLATIILLSDGRSMDGVDPLEAAKEAKQQHIIVHTIGAGSITDGPIPGIPLRYQFAARFDENTLKDVARITGGQYHFVDSASDLKQTYKQISRLVTNRFAKDEVTALAALIAAGLLGTSLIFSEFKRKVL